MIPVLCTYLLVASEPQTTHFYDSYYDAMIEGLGDQHKYEEKTFERQGGEDTMEGKEVAKRELADAYEEQEEPYVENNEMYDEYPEELADDVDYEEYNERLNDQEESYNEDHERDSDRLNDILYDEDTFEGREAPEKEIEENNSNVDIREFTLMISKLLFRLAQI